MRQFSALFIAILAFFIFSACNRSTVSLSETNARNEIPPLGNLQFRFTKALVPDSLLNRWDSTEYISFKPAIAGRFRWESPDQLIFSPAAPFAPATNYTAELRNDLLAFSNVETISKSDPISFHTAPLKLLNSGASWVLQQEGSSKAVPKVDLEFNYAVSPAVLKDKLSVSADGEQQEINVLNNTASRFFSLQLNNVKAADKDFLIKINLDKGLIPDGGKNPTETVLAEDLEIPSPFNLVIQGVEAKHDGITGTVTVLTSQPVNKDDLKTFVKINPATGFQVEATDNGFQITGDGFKVSETYAVKLLKGLRGILGGVLKEEYDDEIGFGELEPNISFASSKGVYLMASGEKNLDIRITNTPKVKLVISKIYASNLLTAQRYGYYPADKRHNDDDEEYGYETSATDGTPGDIIYEKEIETRTLPKSGEGFLLHFNPEDKLPDFKGIYHIMVRSATDYWIRDSRFIALSDIGLIAKESRDKLVVFANSLKTAEAMNGVQITAYGSNNQVLGMGTTDAQGAVELEYTRKEYAGFQPAMLIATTADDFNYMPFQSTRVNTSRFDVSGKTISLTGMDAFIYGERDIYRPGEEIHSSLILRDKQWKSPGEIPVRFRLVMPNGKEMKNIRKMLNAEGSAEIAVALPDEAYTGSYQLEVYSGNDILLGTKTISVEEFVPDRIKVEANISKPELRPGDSASLQITATNLFGPPAANRSFEYEMQLSQKMFRPQQLDNFTFQLTNQTSFFDKVVKEGKTDDAGVAKVSIRIPDMYNEMGLLEATFYSTVFDETGRPVSRTISAEVNTQNVYFGIGYDGYDYFALRQAIRFPLVAVTKDGKPTQANAKVQVIREDYKTVLNRSDGYFRYTSQKEDKILREETINITGQNSFFAFTPQQPGSYEIRVFIPGASTYVSRSFYSYGSWGNNANAFEVDPEGRIDIETDKKNYEVGEKAKVLFKTPFSGRMLVTVENDGLLSWQYVDVAQRTASVELPFQYQHLPNVYITATLFKPHTTSELPLTVAHGFQSVSVESKERKLDVKIRAAVSSHSRTKQQVSVTAAPGSMVTLAVVDEGVLQVSDMATPDPYHWFYQRRKLTTSAYDIYPLLFPELRAKLSSTGGDGVEMKKRTNPMPSGRIKVVSYWSGIQKTNGSGEAKFDISIPGFSGSLRLMAVAYKEQRFGSAEQNMRIADPLVISTGLPRFLSPGDTVDLPVTVTNTTKNAITGSSILKLTGPLAVAGNDKQQTSVPASGEIRLNYRIYAQPRMDTAKIRIEVNGNGVQAFEEIPIAVRPSSTLQKISGSGTIAGDKTEKVELPMSRFIAGTTRYRFMISANPVTAVSDQLAYLIQYPYGCTEQTVSAAFPQLYYSDLSNLGKAKTTAANAAAANINEAIRKIKMRQLQNGGLTMWDEEGEENWWVSAYAAHFLTEANRSGYEVDKTLLETLYQYLNFKLRNRQFINYYYNRNQEKKIAPKEVAYSLYVLALAGKPQAGTMNYYKSNAQWLSLDSKYTLAAGFALAGNRKSFEAMLPSSFQGEVSVTQTGGSFYSPVRDEALALSVLADTDPKNAQIPIMAKHVQDFLRSQRYLSTQERAFAFLALGKIARNASNGNVTGDIKAGTKTIATVNGKAVMLNEKIFNGPAIFDITTRGSGQLYYSWEAEGLDVSGAYVQEDSYIRVRRQFYDRYGKKITGNQFSANQLIIVGISLENSYASPVDNIVITDLLPAGFEIENPRTKEIPGMDWIKDASTPDALDVRDDRIHFFVDLDQSKQVYYYAVRAVTAGSFKMGPVSADAMYNGEYHSYHGGGTVVVKP